MRHSITWLRIFVCDGPKIHSIMPFRYLISFVMLTMHISSKILLLTFIDLPVNPSTYSSKVYGSFDTLFFFSLERLSTTILFCHLLLTKNSWILNMTQLTRYINPPNFADFSKCFS